MPYETDAQGILRSICYNIAPLQLGLFGVILTPTNAQALAKAGWTRKSVKDYIVENARAPRDHLQNFISSTRSHWSAEENPQEMISIFKNNLREIDQADPVQLYVVGGFGSWLGLASGGRITTEKIELPANWNTLVSKFKDSVPNYVFY